MGELAATVELKTTVCEGHGLKDREYVALPALAWVKRRVERSGLWSTLRP